MRRAGGAGPAPSHGRLPPTPPPQLSPHPLPPYPRRAAPRRSGRGCAPAARLRRLLASSSRYFCKRPYGRSASCATYLLGAPLFTSARARPPAPRPRCAPCGRCPGLSRSPRARRASRPRGFAPSLRAVCAPLLAGSAARGAGRRFAARSGLPREPLRRCRRAAEVRQGWCHLPVPRGVAKLN